MDGAERLYPAHWEADVVLADGSTARLRPMVPDDRAALLAFHSRVSERSWYFRFFAVSHRVEEPELRRLLEMDYRDRVALVVVRGEYILGVGRYDRIPGEAREAEVAFLVDDACQGKGVGSVLLEHLAQCARERGLLRFRAEVLPQNTKMVHVFADAGYEQRRVLNDGVVEVDFAIDATAASRAVSESREHLAEARSVARFLTPNRIAVVAGGRDHAALTGAVAANLVRGGFHGGVEHVRLDEGQSLPPDVGLVVVAASPDHVLEVVREAGARGAAGVIVLSGGFAEEGQAGRARQRQLVALVRRMGMRLLGPYCFGFVSTDPARPVNASAAEDLPTSGTVGLFSQSGVLAGDLLARCRRTGLGVSTFVSAGNRADLSANDLLQFWESDPRTTGVLLHLESVGNPRKFIRIARRLSASKPVLAVRTGLHAQRVPMGHAVQPVVIPAKGVDDLFGQAGVVRVQTVPDLLRAGLVLSSQPPPRGRGLCVVGNSDSVGLLVADAAITAGLTLTFPPVDLGPDATAGDLAQLVHTRMADPGVDSIVLVLAGGPDQLADDVLHRVERMQPDPPKPVVAVTLSRTAGWRSGRAVPVFSSPDAAVRALAAVTTASGYLGRSPGQVPQIRDLDVVGARAVVAGAGSPQTSRLPPEALIALLKAVGITLLPRVPVQTEDDAVAAVGSLADSLVLKATADSLRSRPDLAAVRRHITTEAQMRQAWQSLTSGLADVAGAGLVVQPMAPPGVPLRVALTPDAAFGPVLSVGVAGAASELLGDVAYRLPPLTDSDAVAMVQSLAAAPLLHGYRGAPPVDTAAVHDLLHRVGQLSDGVPELLSLRLDPVLATEQGCVVLTASAEIGRADSRAAWYTRRL